MSVVLRKVVVPWATWSRRWTDPRMRPFHTPFVLADCGREGCVVGPYLSEDYKIRDEINVYTSWPAASRELYLESRDFISMREWVATLPVLVRQRLPKLVAQVNDAVGHLKEQRRGAYLKVMLGVVTDMIGVVAEVRGSSPIELSPELQAAYDERDRRVDISARARLAELMPGKGGDDGSTM